MKKIPVSLLIGLAAFTLGFSISDWLAERRLADLGERIRLNEVFFVAIDAASGERIQPSTGYSSKSHFGTFGRLSLPAVIRQDNTGVFQMSWVDIEGMDGFIEVRAGGGEYGALKLKEWATTTPLLSIGPFLQPIELRFQRTGAQQIDDGNAEKPLGDERTQ